MHPILDAVLPDEMTPATVVSLVFHPLLTPAPAGVVILWLGGLRATRAVGWIGLCAAVVVVPLGLYIGLMKLRWGQETSIRANRNQLYLLGVALTAVLLFLLHYFGAPRLLLASIYAGILSGIVGAVTNVMEKVSLHAGVSTGISVVLFSVQPIAGAVAGVLTAVVIAARYRMGRHDLSELSIGVAIPVVSVAAAFHVAGLSIL